MSSEAPITRLSWKQAGVVLAVLVPMMGGGAWLTSCVADGAARVARIEDRLTMHADSLDDCEAGLDELGSVPARLEAIDQRTFETAADVREIRHLLMGRGD